MSGRKHTWPVPFTRSLAGKYSPGQTIFIKGYFKGERFDVNIQTGLKETSGSDLGLHLSCRGDEKKFVANTRQNGQWGQEERHKMNFKAKEEFDLRIRAEADCFEIFSQGEEQFKFKYGGIPFNQLTHLNIEGDVELYHVSWEGKFYDMPYQSKISLKAGQAVYVSGVVAKKADRFNINLKSGEDFALHLNPRFDDKKVVRNSCIGGKWGVEERDGDMPLHNDRTFDIIIGVTDPGFEIFLDGQPHSTFPHRMPMERIDNITIEGDIELQLLYLNLVFQIFLDGQPHSTFPHRMPMERIDNITIEGDIELQGVHW